MKGKKGDLLESTIGKWLFALLILLVIIGMILIFKGSILKAISGIKDSVRFR